jgi:SAM-dependent methyltransferase
MDKKNYIIKDDIDLIKSNKLLFHAYKIKFDLIKKYIGKKNILEIGSGSGIAKYFLKNIKTSDLRKNQNIDFVYNAHIDKLKKKDCIFMVDVFHHLHRPNLVIKNLKKYLKKEGKIIIFEPYVSPMSFIFYLITSFAGPKEKMGLFKKIDLSIKTTGLKKKFDFVMQPQKFFGSKNNKKDVVEIFYIAEYFFIFTGGIHFHRLQKFIPNFVYIFLQKIDDVLNKSKNSIIKKFFATKILIVIE